MAETFTFGLDLSHHQGGGFDFVRAKREGIQFVILKATEGTGFVDSQFFPNLAAARKAGLLVAAYHYVRSNVGVEAQVSNVLRVVPKNVPVIPDVEAGSGGLPLVRDLVATLRSNGYRVPLLYLPRWYWQQIGSPSLAGLPPLWSSRYPDNVVGTIADEFADVPARYWDGYGGLPVALLQFTSSARVAGRSPIDANAFRGSRAQFAALLGGGQPEEDELTPEDRKTLIYVRDIGIENQRRIGHTRADIAALAKVVAADKDIEPAELARIIDEAVAEHTPTAEETAAVLLPLVEDITGRVLGVDNKNLAAEVLRQLREALPTT